jgi:hypothetical protein
MSEEQGMKVEWVIRKAIWPVARHIKACERAARATASVPQFQQYLLCVVRFLKSQRIFSQVYRYTRQGQITAKTIA